MIKETIKSGLSFGLTSATITTLGLMAGLYTGTGSKVAVLGGIITIAIADAFSDALGIHISKESENHLTKKQIWEATFSTLISKFLFALTFLGPVLIFDLTAAVIINFSWGALALVLLSLYLARQENEAPRKVISEHLLIATLVILITYFLGKLIASIFG